MNDSLSEYVRKQFPALKRTYNGYPIAYLDGPGGYQVPECVIDAVTNYLINMNANVGDEFETTVKTSAMIQEARDLFSDFFNCGWDEVIFGANMTTLNFMLAGALMRQMKAGDTVLITEIDHEANRGPWLHLEERGIKVVEVALDIDTCTLDMADFETKLTLEPKVVAVNYASNGVGTINDVGKIVEMARAARVYTVLDAVHYAAHGPIDMKALDADFLLCSAYKFFGPHIGVLYAKKEVQQKLAPLNLRTQSQYPPYMFETGTLHHEGIAGAAAAVKFIADAGVALWNEYQADEGISKENRRNQIVAGLSVFDDYEQELCRYFIDALTDDVAGVTVYGPPKGHPRTSTVSFTLEGLRADQVAKYLGEKGIFVWAGHFYAARLVERLELNDAGGLVRVGIAPYNTKEELDRLLDALKDRKLLEDFVESTPSS